MNLKDMIITLFFCKFMLEYVLRGEIMNKDYECLLFDEVLFLYINGDQKALMEAYDRLKFCDFDENTIRLIIKTEINIIKSRNLTFNPAFMYKFWWLNDKSFYENNKLLPLDNSEYCYLKKGDYKNTLTLSELISIYDEAYYLTHIDKNVHPNIYDEAITIAKYEDYRSWVVCEIYSRLENLYREANGIVDKEKKINNVYRMHRFYDNECHIQHHHKWNRLLDVRNKWRAYSNHYFELFEQ